ncbi:glycosyltransferase [Aeromonas rivipollensis]
MTVYFDYIIGALQSHGGVTVYFDNIVSRCIERGVPSKLLLPNDVENKFGCESLSLEKKALQRYLKASFSLSNQNGYGVFHSSYYRLPSHKELKVITTVHDFTYEKFIKGPAQWVHTWQKNRAIRNSDVVICVSHNTAKDLMQYCPIDPKKIRVIYNGVAEAYHRSTVCHVSKAKTWCLWGRGAVIRTLSWRLKLLLLCQIYSCKSWVVANLMKMK